MREEGLLDERAHARVVQPPPPRSSLSGSLSFAPLAKKSVTHRGYAATDNTASDVRSLGANANTSAL